MTKKVIIELTNRCNLKCNHCFTGRHGGRDDLPLALLQRILAEAQHHGFGHINFTGGDPTVYRADIQRGENAFAEAVRLTCAAGYRFSVNTNGWNFAQTYTQLLPYRAQLETITFSLDGATEDTHDRLRGQGSYRRVLQAMSICVVQELPFTVNMVVTAHNRHELSEMVELTHKLGSRGLRFGHLMHSPITTTMGADLSPWERKLVEAEIHELRRQFPYPIAMAPGYHTTDLYPCAALHLQEVNIDCHGNLTTCCHLSGHGDGVGTADMIGNLQQMGFTAAYEKLVAENQRFRRAKQERFATGNFQDADFFTCWYCVNNY
ncbi:MAG: radical SAM protein, partial [Caldilineaceae bacterium]|nr:radical SAM protein [Caldilineaceae bacterium]